MCFRFVDIAFFLIRSYRERRCGRIYDCAVNKRRRCYRKVPGAAALRNAERKRHRLGCLWR